MRQPFFKRTTKHSARTIQKAVFAPPAISPYGQRRYAALPVNKLILRPILPKPCAAARRRASVEQRQNITKKFHFPHLRTKSKPIKRMLRLPQNRRRRKNAPAQHTLAACIESPDRCGTAAPQRHSFTMPPTTYRPAQDGRLAAQRPLCCWAAAAQIPIHRQIRRADLACLLKISEAIYAGCSNTKACPSCARKNRARLTRCLHPTCHRWSAAPAKTRRRVLAGAADQR